MESLKSLAKANRTNVTEAFVLAIERQHFLDQEIAKGNIILLETKPFFPVLFAPNHGATYRRITFGP